VDFATMPDSRPAAPPPVPPPRPAVAPPLLPRRRPIQFSLRTLLIVMTAVAVAAVLLKLLGTSFLIGLGGALLIFGAPVCCVTAAIYARGRWQTFFIGAAVVTCQAAAYENRRPANFGDLLNLTAGYFVLAAICGGIALWARRFVERRGWHTRGRGGDRWLDE
jgi:uncharacterized membrane protein YccC